MNGGKGVQWNFALPVAAVGFFIGVLCATWIPLWCALAVCAAAVTEIFFTKRTSFIFVFLCGLSAGALRAHLQFFLPPTSLPNPFELLARATAHKLLIIHDDATRAFATGLLLGGTHGFSPEWKQIFRATGTSHIVAVSGSNITILVSGLSHALVALRFFPRQRSVILSVIIFAFVCVTGAPLSIVRAALMALYIECAQAIDRIPHGLHALACATLLIGLTSPRAFFDIGFQLSAAATFGLIISEKIEKSSVWMQTLRATIAATLCTLPLSIFYFGSTSAISLIANLIIVPLVPLCMAASLVTYMLSFFPAAVAHILMMPFESILNIILKILQTLAAVPGSTLTFSVPLWAVILWYLGLVVYAIITYNKRI